MCIRDRIYFKDIADRYLLEIVPTKAARTQIDNVREMQNLIAFFNNPPAPITEIRPIHIRQYMNWRTDNGKKSTVRANREKSLLSHLFNIARDWGALDTVNPCQGIKGYTEEGRDAVSYTHLDVYKRQACKYSQNSHSGSADGQYQVFLSL